VGSQKKGFFKKWGGENPSTPEKQCKRKSPQRMAVKPAIGKGRRRGAVQVMEKRITLVCERRPIRSAGTMGELRVRRTLGRTWSKILEGKRREIKQQKKKKKTPSHRSQSSNCRGGLGEKCAKKEKRVGGVKPQQSNSHWDRQEDSF